MWAALTSDEGRTVAVLVALALLVVGVTAALVFVARDLRAVAFQMRRLHLQQATIVGMLLRAGFRPAPRGKDWFDDAHETQEAGPDPVFTRIEWRPPWSTRVDWPGKDS